MEKVKDEISLKDIFLKLKEVLSFVFEKKGLLIGLFLIVFAALTIRYNNQKDKYQGQLTFVFANKNVDPLSGVSSKLKSFGIGGEGTSDEDKLKALAKSRNLLSKTLFKSLEISGKRDLLINHLINTYEVFKNDDTLKGFRFKEKDFEATRLSRKAYYKIFGRFFNPEKQSEIIDIAFEESSGFFSVKSLTLAKELSYKIPKIHFETISDHYYKTDFEPKKKSYETFLKRQTEVKTSIDLAEIRLAKLKDSRRSSFLKINDLEEKKLEYQLQGYYMLLAEITKQLEMADYLVSVASYNLNKVDNPSSVMRSTKPPLFFALAKNALISILLSLFTIISYYFIIALKRVINE